MTATTTITAEPGSPILDMSRDFDATPEQLLRAHTEPELLAQWLGPHRLTTEVEQLDARHGGAYRFINGERDGSATYAFRGVHHGDPTVDGITRTFEFEGMPGHVTLEKVWFEALGDGRTRLHARSVSMAVEDRDGMLASGMEKGVNEGYERLDALLPTL
ncbi:MAG: SRPBCC domain-containing protein [Solirubrobacteraceae bacterium]|nr:SRPBCC domain-containing protein [Solirubrobacteraceae bacterium]